VAGILRDNTVCTYFSEAIVPAAGLLAHFMYLLLRAQ